VPFQGESATFRRENPFLLLFFCEMAFPWGALRGFTEHFVIFYPSKVSDRTGTLVRSAGASPEAIGQVWHDFAI
jgi:hypothetical protein